jgi:hypothetical protein
VDALTNFFWNSPQALRYGITENLHGFEEIASFRKARSTANLARKILRLDIVTFNRDHAHITLEFERTLDNHPILSPSWAAKESSRSASPKVGESPPRTFLFSPESRVSFERAISGRLAARQSFPRMK